MATIESDELRCRVTIDRDMGELFDRLANAKRQPREIVHLLRLGLMYENILNGKVATVAGAGLLPPAISADGASSGAGAIEASAQRRSSNVGKTKQVAATDKVEAAPADSVESFVEATGLTADFFSSKPPAFT